MNSIIIINKKMIFIIDNYCYYNNYLPHKFQLTKKSVVIIISLIVK